MLRTDDGPIGGAVGVLAVVSLEREVVSQIDRRSVPIGLILDLRRAVDDCIDDLAVFEQVDIVSAVRQAEVLGFDDRGVSTLPIVDADVVLVGEEVAVFPFRCKDQGLAGLDDDRFGEDECSFLASCRLRHIGDDVVLHIDGRRAVVVNGDPLAFFRVDLLYEQSVRSIGVNRVRHADGHDDDDEHREEGQSLLECIHGRRMERLGIRVSAIRAGCFSTRAPAR